MVQVISQGKLAKAKSAVCNRDAYDLPYFGLVHLCEGSGFFKSEPSGEIDVNPGDTIILMPDIAHSYGSKPDCTWNEYWILLNGDFVNDCLEKRLFSARYPILRNNYASLWDELYRIDDSGIGADHRNALAIALFGLSAATAMRPRNSDNVTKLTEKVVAAMSDKIIDAFFDFDSCAKSLGYSSVHMRRIFKFETGYTPVEYFNRLRIEEVKRRLIYSSNSISEVAAELGWHDEVYFRKIFKKFEDMSPSMWRKIYKS